MNRLDKPTTKEIAELVVNQLSYHTAEKKHSQGYQVQLPNGTYLTIMDYRLHNRRTLWFYGRKPGSPYRRLAEVVKRPKSLPQDGPWFVNYTDKQSRKAVKTIEQAIQFAYGSKRGNGDKIQDPLMIQINYHH